MAHIIVKNSLNNKKAVRVNVSIPKFYVTGYNGDPRYVLEVGTTYPSASGTKIRPSYTDSVIGKEDLDQVIDDSVGEIASQIDWDELVPDVDSPYVLNTIPEDNNEASISSNIYIDIVDDIPSAGIDLSEAQVILNNGARDFDITSECEIEGTPFHYTLKWSPPAREFRHYE